jgi:ComF family protein
MSGNRKQTYLQRKNYNMPLIEELFNILAPHECVGCRKEGSLLCYDCGLALSSIPPRCYLCQRWDTASNTCQACKRRTPIHSLWAIAKYERAAKELLHKLKFERSRAAANPIARLMAERVPTGSNMIVTHIPTSSVRARQRGYDQAALIAKALARQLGCPYVPCLARSGQHRQVGQSREIRKKQMDGVFRAVGSDVFANKHVLLVDDVLTTGATCEAAARVLRRAGAKRVSAAVFAVA